MEFSTLDEPCVKEELNPVTKEHGGQKHARDKDWGEIPVFLLCYIWAS